MNSNRFWVLCSLWSPVLSGSLDSSVQTGHLFSTGLNIWIVSWSDGGSELRHNKTSVGAERTHSTWRRRDGTVWMIWVWTTLITVFGLTNETECVESVWRTLLMSEAACSNELGGWRNLKTRLTMFISLYWDECLVPIKTKCNKVKIRNRPSDIVSVERWCRGTFFTVN